MKVVIRVCVCVSVSVSVSVVAGGGGIIATRARHSPKENWREKEREREREREGERAGKKENSGHPESNQGPSDVCKCLQSDALPTEL